jgi:ankyrin repeat protein
MKRRILLLLLISLTMIHCSLNTQQRSDDRFYNLFYQVAIGDTERVRQLLRQGYDVNRAEDTFEKLTPLMIAAKEGHADMVYLLLSFRADPNARTRNGHTALMLSAYNRYPKVVKILLEGGADPNIASNAGHTALSEITQSDKEEIIILLTEKSAK